MRPEHEPVSVLKTAPVGAKDGANAVNPFNPQILRSDVPAEIERGVDVAFFLRVRSEPERVPGAKRKQL